MMKYNNKILLIVIFVLLCELIFVFGTDISSPKRTPKSGMHMHIKRRSKSNTKKQTNHNFAKMKHPVKKHKHKHSKHVEDDSISLKPKHKKKKHVENGNFKKLASSKKAKITVISNNNVLKQSQKKADNRGMLLEEKRKSHAEEMKKMSKEERQKYTKEKLKKKTLEVKQKAQAKLKEKKRKSTVLEKAKKKRRRERRRKRRERRRKKYQHANESRRKKLKERARKQGITSERKRKREKRKKKYGESRRKGGERKRKQEKRKKKYGERRRKGNERRKKSQNRLKYHRGFRDYGSTYEYGKVKANVLGDICIVKGLVRAQHGKRLVYLGRLPSNCRPRGGRLIFTGMTERGPVRVDVARNGAIYQITGFGEYWISLEGIHFTVNNHHHSHLVWGWRDYGYGYRGAQIERVGNMCVLSGLIRSGRWGYLGRVPRNCYPQKRIIFSANNHQTITRVDVLPNGYYLRSGGSHNHGWVSLSGLSYFPQFGQQVSLRSGWVNYNQGYGHATYKRQGKLCALSGLIKNNRNWRRYNLIAILPSRCRPKRRRLFGVDIHYTNARVDILPNGRVYFISHPNRYKWLTLNGITFDTR